MAHCRGDRELDLDRVRLALESEGDVRRMLPEAAESLGVVYGTVNPFLEGELVQIFDSELHKPLGVPGTVMTNAGDHTWAVEFRPAELLQKLRDARWADIVQPSADQGRGFWGVREPESIGILTGNPSDSGLDLCAEINRQIRTLLGKNALGDVSMPKVVMVSSPAIGISMEMDQREEALREALLRGIDDLCVAGARILAHPAHTTHYFAPEMAAYAKSKGARFMSMVEATSTWLSGKGISEITLLGTRYVTDFRGQWSVYRDAFPGIKVHTPSEEGWAKIHALGYAVQQTGPSPLWFNWMRDLLRDEVPDSCQYVVVAMTEFTPVVRHLKNRGRRGKILVDPINIYAEAVAREYLGVTGRQRIMPECNR